MKNTKKLLISLIVSSLSVFVICACIFSTQNNCYANSQTNNNGQVRYVEDEYSPEIADSMQQIQKSYNNQLANFKQKLEDIQKSKSYNDFNDNTSEAIFWKFYENDSTLHISGVAAGGESKHEQYTNAFDSGMLPGWKTDKNIYYKINQVIIDDEINPKSCFGWFGSMEEASEQEKVHLSNIKSIINLYKLDMHQVTNAEFMFAGCDLLNDLDQYNMPQHLNSVTEIEAMFSLTKFDESFYEKISSQFTSINNAKYAFSNCETTTKLDIRDWILINKTSDISYIFCNDTNLRAIYSKNNTDWSSFDIKAEGMFKNCQSLKGEAGTKYIEQDEKIRDSIAFAKSDTTPSSVGYFSNAWIPLQAEAKGEDKPVDFYPAFNIPNDVKGYKFAVKKGEAYNEIPNDKEHPISMNKIYQALDPINTGETTVYFQKTDPKAEPLKCYTVKDINYLKTYVYIGAFQNAKEYCEAFKEHWQKDKFGNSNGIVSAELGVGNGLPNEYGAGWDTNHVGRDPGYGPTINGVPYWVLRSEEEKSFYYSYGGSTRNDKGIRTGGLLSPNSGVITGTHYERNDQISLYCPSEANPYYWGYRDICWNYGIILAKKFAENDKAVVSAPTPINNCTYNNSEQIIANDGYAYGGTMQYAFSSSETEIPTATKWKDTIDTKKDAGTYYLWYYAKGDSMHTSSDISYIKCCIDKAESPITYNQTRKEFRSHPGFSCSEDILPASNAVGGIFYSVKPATTNEESNSHEYFNISYDGKTLTSKKNAPEGIYKLTLTVVDLGDKNHKQTRKYTDVTWVINPWIPMQAEIADGSKIDFYPAFNNTKNVSGYKFAVKDGNEYKEISSDNITMKSINNALVKNNTKTLYYKIEDFNAPTLKCYTTLHLPWDDVFELKTNQGSSVSYTSKFKQKYQIDNRKKDNGITTAELDDNFGTYWDASKYSLHNTPKVNGINYGNSTDSFYASYGDFNESIGVLPPYSNYVWGNNGYGDSKASSWETGIDTGLFSWRVVLCSSPFNNIVLAHEFRPQ
ncbi:MAG: hypothetical protein Q4E88_04170 [Coriobacteriia bacterium]|nr:hypothetical protein [Coriobacteriia bacterium]